MQHAHVKRKEKTMNRYMLEEFHNDPALLRRRLTTAAHRERARAIGDGFLWLGGKLAALAAQVVTRIKPAHPGRWIERLG
jgi:tartrate dehydratase alpha subunit/fumarate hydratase class I-like protein